MKTCATIGEEDTNLFLVTDDIDEAVALIRVKSNKKSGLKHVNKRKPSSRLFETK